MIPAVDYIRILPELVLSIFGIIVMMVDPVLPEQGSKKPLGIVALVGTLAALAATAYQTGFYGEAFYHMVRVDTFSVFFHVVVLMIALVVIHVVRSVTGLMKMSPGPRVPSARPSLNSTIRWYSRTILTETPARMRRQSTTTPITIPMIMSHLLRLSPLQARTAHPRSGWRRRVRFLRRRPPSRHPRLRGGLL